MTVVQYRRQNQILTSLAWVRQELRETGTHGAVDEREEAGKVVGPACVLH